MKENDESAQKVKRLHFVSDFDRLSDEDPALGGEPYWYRCQRCGEEILGSHPCWEHRKGLLSDCRRNQLRSILP